MGLKEKTAFSYLRVSGKSQIQGDGLRRQRQAVRVYAQESGIGIAREFVDAGVSGTCEDADRPGLSDLLDQVARNGMRPILVERADRLARDLMIGEMILTKLAEMGVRVVAADSGTDLSEDDDPAKVLIRQMLGAFAQFEKTVLVKKLRAARDRLRQRTGRCEGPRSFGHHPHEVKVLERLRELNRKPRQGRRRSAQQIAATLQSEGWPTRSGET